MSTRPGVVTSRTYVRSSAAFLALATTVLAACDQPTELSVDRAERVQVSIGSIESGGTCGSSVLGQGNPKKSVQVAVTLSNGDPAEGVLVTLIHPTGGPACEETTTAGVATFLNVSAGAKFVALVRDEVNTYASQLSIAPPNPGDNNELVNLVAETPSVAGTHQRPTLLSGASCTAKPLTWADYATGLGAPCEVSGGGGPPYSVSVALPTETGAQGTLIGLPVGVDPGKIIVTALSPWSVAASQSQTAACNLLVWLSQARRDECSNPNVSDGPAVLQAVSRATATGPTTGTFDIGAHGSPLAIETVMGGEGFTFFGTAKLTPDGYQVHVVPGMCRVDAETTVIDETDPSGSSPLNIMETFSTLGLRTVGTAGFMQLAPVPSTAIVGAIIENNSGGSGEIAISYGLTTGGGNYAIKATFSISAAGACTMNAGSGKGLGSVGGSTVKYLGTCAEVEPGLFKLAFVLTGLPSTVNRSTMTYALKAARDNIDAARFNNLKGAIPYAGQFDTTCPVPTNNDGRYDLGI